MALGTQFWLIGLIVVVCLAQPAVAFGAGNISSSSTIEGINWRHGDIEDALLGIIMARTMGKRDQKFSKVMVARVYFGNWLRDYSQAVDVGTIKSVSYEAIRLVVAILAFMNFGFGSKEFEVTPERLGCYRPEEHIDNPKGYAAGDDARRYWRGLRGPIDEETELAMDPESGMISYIANERAGITTSAGLLRHLLGRCIELGRVHARNGDEEALYESMRLLGTALHCLEDFFAHSNYVELALIEMGERGIFPHVGRDVRVRLRGMDRGSVYPVVTGTFGEVDFLHSVAGEVSDKLKQNEMQELEQYLEDGKNNDTSLLRNLLAMLPSSLFGGEDEVQKMDEIQNNTHPAQMHAQPHREPEEITQWVSDIFRQVVPIIEWHDKIMKIISDALPTIPILPKIIEQLEDQLNGFVMATIAPFVVPVIQQIQNEMQTGSENIIESSKADQHRVFEDDRASDPTHSMLSKDHFTNLLNEPAGKASFEMVKWVVPQIMSAMDDEDIDINRTVNRIIYGVLHHPAQRHQGRDGVSEGREASFRCVESWWNEMPEGQRDEYRQKLSRQGVENGENHKEGEWDNGHGHGCLGKLEQHSQHGGKKKKKEEWDDKIANAAAGAIIDGVTNAFSGLMSPGGRQDNNSGSDGPGGLLGSLVGGFMGKNDDSSGGRRSPDGRQGYNVSSSSYRQSSPGPDGRQSYGGREDYGGRQDYGDRQDYGRTQHYGESQDYGRQGHNESSSYHQSHYGSDDRQSYGDRQDYGGRQDYGRQQHGGDQDYGRTQYQQQHHQEHSQYDRPPAAASYHGGSDYQGQSQYGRPSYGEHSQYDRPPAASSYADNSHYQGHSQDYGRNQYSGGNQDYGRSQYQEHSQYERPQEAPYHGGSSYGGYREEDQSGRRGESASYYDESSGNSGYRQYGQQDRYGGGGY